MVCSGVSVFLLILGENCLFRVGLFPGYYNPYKYIMQNDPNCTGMGILCHFSELKLLFWAKGFIDIGWRLAYLSFFLLDLEIWAICFFPTVVFKRANQHYSPVNNYLTPGNWNPLDFISQRAQKRIYLSNSRKSRRINC